MNIISRRIQKSVLLFACVVIGNATAHTDEVDGENTALELSPREQSVVTILDAYAAAYAATDLDAIRNLTLSDGAFSYFEGASTDNSWDEYEHHAAAEMPSFSEARYVFSNVRPVVSEQMAFATFDWQLDVVVISEQFEGGRHPVSMRGVGTAVLIMEEGGWRLRHLHTAQAKAKPQATH